ncbi:MAG TPA: hypothetical protein VNG33_21770 [Polyangiaceae bacterium]|nr:hypothetical protein [Polyangiaceae bacterium]
MKLDPQLGALLHLADCYAKNGQLASAWGSFREAEELARMKNDDRATFAKEQAAQLEPRLSRLTIRVSEAARLPGLVVQCDGAPVGPALWGTASPINAGKHGIEVSASGFKTWKSVAAVVREGSEVSVEVPTLEKLATGGAAAPGNGQTPDASPQATSDTNPGGGQRIAALSLGGLGIVGLGVGAFMGLSARSSFVDSKSVCNDAGYCTADGTALRKSASGKATVSTVTTAVGIAALVTGGILWFTAPKKEQVASRGTKNARRWAVGATSQAWGLEVQRDF